MTSARVPGLRPRILLRGLTLIATLVAAGFLIELLGLRQALDAGWIDQQIRGHGLRGDSLFMLAGALAIGIGLPRQAVCFLAGYAFGFVEGVLWATLASLLGCLGAFCYARWLGRAVVVAHFPDRIARLDAFLAGNTLSMTLLLRLLPVGSNLLTNLAAGVSGVALLPFLGGSLLGYLPQTVVFVLLGSGIQVDPPLRIGVSVVLFVASGVLGIWLVRRYRHGRRLDPAIEAVLDEEEDAREDGAARAR